ncbi:MAG: DegT/DnrJ/EryC1/StrS family aminotransferase, partial [Rickettsiales bacterium]
MAGLNTKTDRSKTMRIPLARPGLSGDEARNLQACVDTNYVSSIGPFVTEFETLIAGAAEAGSCVATASGTAGLHLALIGCGVERDDLVILPSYTFIASANAVSHAGAVPWLFDIDAESWTLDARLVADTLAAETERRGPDLVHKASGRKVAAVMPVYTLGVPADMDAIAAIAAEYRLPVIADAAAAHGARYKGRPLGKLGADLSVFSFNGNKTVTAGGGGGIFGDDAALVGRVRHICSTARISDEYDHDAVGYNYRMTNVAAAVGCAQMKRLDDLVAAKQRIRKTYDDALAGLAGLSAFPSPDW